MSVMPLALQAAIQNALEETDISVLKACAQRISERYRMESGAGKRLLTTAEEASAYALVRMPATYGAIETALTWALECSTLAPESLLDCGAGSGAASWAAAELIPSLAKIVCLEREPAMRSLGSRLMEQAEPDVLRKAAWQEQDLVV